MSVGEWILAGFALGTLVLPFVLVGLFGNLPSK